TLSHTHALSHTHTHALTHTHFHRHTHTHTHSQTHTHTLSHTQTLSQTHTHTLSMSQESSYHIHLPWNSPSYNSAQLCSSSVGYIYFMLAQASIHPPLRFSLDYAMTLHDMIALNM